MTGPSPLDFPRASGFRLRALAALTLAKRLKFEELKQKVPVK
jgi:hypothetical protein